MGLFHGSHIEMREQIRNKLKDVSFGLIQPLQLGHHVKQECHGVIFILLYDDCWVTFVSIIPDHNHKSMTPPGMSCLADLNRIRPSRPIHLVTMEVRTNAHIPAWIREHMHQTELDDVTVESLSVTHSKDRLVSTYSEQPRSKRPTNWLANTFTAH